jgi:hypothetical protein
MAMARWLGCASAIVIGAAAVDVLAGAAGAQSPIEARNPPPLREGHYRWYAAARGRSIQRLRQGFPGIEVQSAIMILL